MHQTTNAEYYRLRQRQEHERAAQAPNPLVRRIHEQLASEYAALVMVSAGGVVVDELG